MDSESKKQWQLAHPGTKLVTWKELSDFLDTRSRALEVTCTRPAQQTTTPPQQFEKRVQSYSVSCSDRCNEKHKLHLCPEFKRMQLKDRLNLAKSKRVCFNCLQPGHSANECSSKFTCRECMMKHHTLLHRPKSPLTSSQVVSVNNSIANHSSPSTNQEQSSIVCQNQEVLGLTSTDGNVNSVLLSTAIVSIKDQRGRNIQLRALLDSGSQASFITESMTKALMLRIQRSKTTISTLGSTKSQKALGFMSAKLNDVLDINLHVIPKITNAIPSQEIDVSQLRHIHNLQLADPQFNVPGKIDILLGADVIEDVMLDNRIKDNGLHIKESLFGWIVSGPINANATESILQIA